MKFKFRINYLPNNTKEAEIWGTLQRWQGTDTKIDASGYVIRLQDTETEPAQTRGMYAVGFLMFLGLATISTSSWMFGIPFIIIGAIGLFALSWYTPAKEEKITVSFRARDYLLQRIIDTFKSEEEVEVYVPEITQQAQTSGKS